MTQEKAPALHYHGHRQRLKERFSKDPAAVPDYEMLELILYWIYPRQDVKPLAKSLLAEHGSLQAFIKHTLHTGQAPFHFVCQMLYETARRMTLHELRQDTLLNNTHRVLEYLHLTMSHTPIEQFRLLFLDKKYGLLKDELHQGGTLDQVPLYPREVLRRGLELNAACLIMAHNHPSGDPQPSRADIDITRHLVHSLMPFSLRILDHFIIGRHGYFSFREQGLLNMPDAP